MYWLVSALSFVVIFISLEALWMQAYKGDARIEIQREFTGGDALLPFLYGITTLPFILYVSYYIARKIKNYVILKTLPKKCNIEIVKPFNFFTFILASLFAVVFAQVLFRVGFLIGVKNSSFICIFYDLFALCIAYIMAEYFIRIIIKKFKNETK
ncbi:MAG TPA: hypothetical protein PKW30_06185 [Campylobacterales bacterium]|nr:hypothetical protein [Campylobacterales bacterium]